MSVIDFVIRHVEANARDLRVAYQRLGQLHRALDITKEEELPELGGSLEPLALVDDLITRVRKISVDLRPPLLDEVGLVSALPNSRSTRQTPGCRQTTRSPASASSRSRSPMPSATRMPATCASPSPARPGESGCRSATTDDGRGFDPDTLDAAAAHGQLGVLGMQERIRARGGRFTLTSRAGAGSTIEVELSTPPTAASG
jgi:signal transduction histidine kinase